MKGSSRALFQAVVVMGAALAGCDRSATPAGEVKTVTPVPVPVPVPEVVPVPEAVTAERVEVAPSAGIVAPVEVSPVVAVEEGEAKKERKTRGVKAKQESRERCPEGSEMPYPPCFYIL